MRKLLFLPIMVVAPAWPGLAADSAAPNEFAEAVVTCLAATQEGPADAETIEAAGWTLDDPPEPLWSPNSTSYRRTSSAVGILLQGPQCTVVWIERSSRNNARKIDQVVEAVGSMARRDFDDVSIVQSVRTRGIAEVEFRTAGSRGLLMAEDKGRLIQFYFGAGEFAQASNAK